MLLANFNKRLLHRPGQLGLVAQMQAANHPGNAQVIVPSSSQPDVPVRVQVVEWLDDVAHRISPTKA